MQISTISKDNTLIYKGIGILWIVHHNFFHWIKPFTGENEWTFNPKYVLNLINGLIENPLEFINLFFSFFAYGHTMFIFISAVGLTLSMQKRRRSWGVFVVERLKKLYPLIFIGFILLFFAHIIMYGQFFTWEKYRALLHTVTFLNTLVPGMWDKISGPWWFFGLIFQLYVLFPLLFHLINKYRIKAFLGVCLVCYAWIFLSQYPQFFHYPDTQLYLFQNAPGHLPEFALGILVALSPGKKIHPCLIILSLIVFGLGCFFKPFFPFTFLTASVLIYWAASKIVPFITDKTKILKTILLFYGTISYMIFAVNGPLRSPFIKICGDTFYGKLFGALLFVLSITAVAIIGNMMYKWVMKHIDSFSFKKLLNKKTLP